jgi:peptide/nickel transport system substrate-binding protein
LLRKLHLTACLGLSLLGLAPALAAPRDSLVVALPGEPERGFDPVQGWGEYGHPLFQSTLLRRDADLATQPDLALDWVLSADRLRWTLRLRQDARFSDGRPLTAEDVAFTYRQAAQAGGAVDLSVLDSVRVAGPFELEFRLKQPRVTFQNSFFTLGIVPAGGHGADYGRNPLGSGPFRLLHWQPGQQLIVEANPFWYGKPPAFRRLTFLFTGEANSHAAAMAGQLDLLAVPPSLAGRVPAGMHRVVARSVDNRGIVFPMEPAPSGNSVTADPAIRRAINVALDRKALAAQALLGYGTPAYGPADGLPWSNPEARLPDADPATAAALLEEAGWRAGRGGLRSRDGVPARFPLLYFAGDSTRQALALSVAEMLRPLGIVAEPQGRSREDTRRLMRFSAVLFGWGSHNPVETYYLHASAQAGRGFFNAGHYNNPVVDAHLEAAQGAASLEASFPEWRAAEWDGTTGYGMRGDAAWAWLVNLDHIYLAQDCLDLGRLQVEPHGHGWPITAGILDWRWTCP